MAQGSHARPWTFFLLTLAISWVSWIPLALWGVPALQFPGFILMAIGGVGPALAAIFLVQRHTDREARRDYWRRVLELRRIPARWYAVIFLLYPSLHVLAIVLTGLGAGEWASWEGLARYAANPLSIIPYLFFMLVFGPLPEELGWRGYALGGLQQKHNALASSLLLGIVWAVWHLPLFFMQGTYQAGIGIDGIAFFEYMIAILANSILLTWVYNNTKGSTLSAVLLHFVINLSGEIFEYSAFTGTLQTFLVVLTAVAVVFFWGPRSLRRNSAGGEKVHASV